MIHTIRGRELSSPPDPGQTRSKIAGVWVDWSGTEPAPNEVAELTRPRRQRPLAAIADDIRRLNGQERAELIDKVCAALIQNGTIAHPSILANEVI